MMTRLNSTPLPTAAGVGLKPTHYTAILDSSDNDSPWFEVITENYFNTGGRPLKILEKIRQDTPISCHGVCYSAATQPDYRKEYLKKMRAFVRRLEPSIVSDHLCWSASHAHNTHDLLPFPFEESTLKQVIRSVQDFQEAIGMPILLENISRYTEWIQQPMEEAQFLTEVTKATGCGILLDINNVYVNSHNFGYDPMTFFQSLPTDAIQQYHMAGHGSMDSEKGNFLFDTHEGPIIEDVWDLFEECMKIHGPKPTLIEWDTEVPDYSELAQERILAQACIDAATENPPVKPIEPREAIPLNRESFKTAEFPEAAINSFQKCVFENSNRHLLDKKLVTHPERLYAYLEGYALRLKDAIEDVFTRFSELVEPTTIYELCLEYAQKHPSQSYDLGKSVEKLPEFLENHPFHAKFPDLVQLCYTERKMAECFHAYETPSLFPAELAEVVQQGQISAIQLQPYVQAVRSSHAVLDFWKNKATSVRKQESFYYMSRNEEGTVFLNPINRWEFRFISEMQRTHSLEKALAQFNPEEEEFFEKNKVDLGETLAQLSQNGHLSLQSGS